MAVQDLRLTHQGKKINVWYWNPSQFPRASDSMDLRKESPMVTLLDWR